MTVPHSHETREGLEQRTRAAWERLYELGGEPAVDEAGDQAGLPRVFVWTNLRVAQLGALLVALRIRLLEVGS